MACRLAVISSLVVLTILIRVPVLMEPWGGDQGGFGYAARGILEGRVPYRDVYDLTGYGVFFTFALFFKLFGIHMISAHIGHVIVSVVTVLLVYLVTLRALDGRAALAAGLCYTIFANGLGFSGFGYENRSAWGTYWYISQREVFMAPLIAGAVYLSMILKSKRGWVEWPIYFSIGILVGLAVVYKLTAVLMLAALSCFLGVGELMEAKVFSAGRGRERWRCLSSVLAKQLVLVAGCVVIQLPFLYYFWIHHALADMYKALFVHVSLYARLSRGLRIETMFSGHYSILRESLGLWLLAAVACLFILFQDRKRDNLLIAVWAVISLVMVWGQGKFFGYHFIILVPPFAVLASYGMPKLLDLGRGMRGFLSDSVKDIRKCFIVVTLGATLVGFGIINYDYYRWHVLFVFGRISMNEYYRVFNEFPTHPYSFRSDYEVVDYVRQDLRKDDRMAVVFGAGDTVIHFLLGMEDVTRFLQSWYLFPSDATLANQPLTRLLRKEFIDQIIAAAPRYILCVHMSFDDLVSLPTVKDDPEVIEFAQFVRHNYILKRTFLDNRFLFEKRAAEESGMTQLALKRR
ncbi:MAG: glycosyltransferase family 39 protein [Acidobacteriia bacterium]|nr:glycosyltransferase family 39 protein [Terriglobia bacterium]